MYMYLRVQDVFVGLNLVFIACNVHICCNGIEDPPGQPQRETLSRLRREMKEEEWLDPGDMLGTDFSSFKTDGGEKETQLKPKASRESTAKVDIADFDSSVQKSENRLRQNCDMPFFKQLARVVTESFKGPGKYYVTIKLSNDDLKTLNEFKDKDVDGERIHDVLEIFSGIFNKVQEDERNQFTVWSHITMTMDYNKEKVAILVIVIVLIIILLVFEYRTYISWRQQFWYFIVGLFLISIPWEWFRLYRKEFAKKQSEMIKHVPSICIPNDMTISQSISLWWSNLVTWKEDECAKYQEAILVDPVWEVSPSQAFSITVTRFLFQPLEYIAEAFGRSFKAFFVHVPAQWQPFMFLGIGIMLLLCLLFFTKSRIKFGFFEIGPAIEPLRRLHADDMKALEDRIGRAGEPLRRLHADDMKALEDRIGRAGVPLRRLHADDMKALEDRIGPAGVPLRRLHEDDVKALEDRIVGRVNENIKQDGLAGNVPRIERAVVHDEKHGIQDLQSPTYDMPMQDETRIKL